MTNDGGIISSFKKLLSRPNTSRTTEGYKSTSTCFYYLQHLTAAFVDDLEPKKDYVASTPRHVGRIGVILATIVAFAAIIPVLFPTAAPISRTIRHYGPHKDSQGQNFFTFRQIDEDGFSNITSHICFCRKTNINWPDYVSFFILTLSRDGNGNSSLKRISNITDWQQFCQSTTLDPGSPQERDNSLAYNACLIMVEAVVAPNISQTCLESATLIGPALLNDTIASRVTGGLDQILWNYRILNSLNDTRRDYDKIVRLHSLWTSVVGQFYKNHMSSDQDYWYATNRSNGVLNDVDGNETALGMEVQWYIYANICNPPFCDVVKQNSWWLRVFLLVAQLGGLSTLVLLFVRVCLWPVLRHIFGWPLLCRPDRSQEIDQRKLKRSSFSYKVSPVDQTTSTSPGETVDVARVSTNGGVDA